MKNFLFIIVFITWASGSFSQDYMLFKNGEKIAVTLLTVADEYVRYYLFNDPTRKMYAKDTALLSKIIFQNGKEQTYSKIETQDTQNSHHNPGIQKENNLPPKTDIPDTDQSPQPTGDLLFLKDGRHLAVVVLEIMPEIVKYKDFDNLTGPIYSIYKSDIAQIILQNGKIETFTKTENRKITSPPLPLPPLLSPPLSPVPVKSHIRFGIKGGINLSTFAGLEETFDLINEVQGTKLKSENKIGFHIGLIGQLNMTDRFILQPELLFSLQGDKGKKGYALFTDDLYYLQLSVPLVYKIDVLSRMIILGTGPYLAYGIAGSENTFDAGIKKFDYGFTFLGGVQFGKIQITCAYDLGMYEIINTKRWNIVKGIDGIPALHSRNLKISLGYFF
jgi:hypothetical protein